MESEENSPNPDGLIQRLRSLGVTPRCELDSVVSGQ